MVTTPTKTKQLRNQKVITFNHEGNHYSYFRRDVTVWKYNDGSEEAECQLHGGKAVLRWTGGDWRVEAIYY